MPTSRLATLLARTLAAALALVAAGCGGESDDVVLYTSVDERYARPIIDAFEADTGLSVRLVTDTEATKGVGLVERLIAERDRPVADVWWGNEPFLTIRLAGEGVLAPFEPDVAGELPPLYRDGEGRWYGNGLRARVFAVAGDAQAPPESLEALLDERFRDRVVIARPTAGTTGSHVAALYVAWGQERADAYFRSLRDNGARLVTGNSHSAEAVARGEAGVGLTDNDDVHARLADIYAFSKNQEQLSRQMQDQFGGIFPFEQLEEMNRQNIAMFQNAMRMFTPFPNQSGSAGNGSAGETGGAAASEQDKDESIDTLQRQLEELQRQVAALGGKKPE